MRARGLTIAVMVFFPSALKGLLKLINYSHHAEHMKNSFTKKGQNTSKYEFNKAEKI